MNPTTSPCSVCLKPIEGNDPLRCSEPHCGKLFHPFCGDLNLTCWKALTSDVGLRWFCTGCRTDLGGPPSENKDVLSTLSHLAEKIQELESTLRQLTAVSKDSGTAVAAPGQDLLPEEVLVKIFTHLNAGQLVQVRGTCRSWYRIVGRSSTLMDRLVLRFPGDTILDRNSDQNEVLASTTSRFTRASLHTVRVVQVDSWWPAMAEHLQVLTLAHCKLSLEMLLTMLRPMVNLKCLKFTSERGFRVSDDATVDFQLKSMERLTLYDTNFSPILEIFRQLFPNLKALKLHVTECSEAYERKVQQFVEGIQGTVQHLKMYNSLTLWNKIMPIRKLNLESMSVVSTYNCTLKVGKEQIIELSQSHADIEHLNIKNVQDITDTILNTVGANLPHLKRLKAYICGESNETLTFLRQMPNLEALKIVGYEKSLNGYGNRKLQRVLIERIKLNASCFECFPNVHTLCLQELTVRDWCAVFDPRLKHLQNVNLKNIIVLDTECLISYLESLHNLSVACYQMSASFLSALISLSPNLEHVCIEDFLSYYDDKLVELICRKLMRLKSLNLYGNKIISDASVGYINQYCREIEQVTIRYCEQISIDAMRSLKFNKPKLIIFYFNNDKEQQNSHKLTCGSNSPLQHTIV